MKFRKSDKKPNIWVIEQIPPDHFDAYASWLFQLDCQRQGHGDHTNGARWIAFKTILGIAELIQQSVEKEGAGYGTPQ